MGHGACGAQGGGCCVGVEVGLGGEVRRSSSQVGVHSAVARAAVREGVRSLSHGGRDVGLLPAVASGALRGDVLLSLQEEEHQERALWGLAWGRKEGQGGVGRRGAGGGQRLQE